MPPKKTAGAAAPKKAAAPAAHASYKDMIKEAILNLKERNGSSRQAIKKYVKANNKITTTSETQFDSLFNKALKSGVDKGDFSQPKGPSGPVKLAKKEAKPAAEKKAAAPKKEKTESKPKVTKAKTATKKAATKTTKAKAAPKTKTAAKPKANTATKRAPSTKAKATKKETPAPAVQDVPTVLKKTSSGRVSKQKTTSGAAKATTKKAPAKKAAAKKATPKKASA
ncbi:Histone H1 [Cyphellophora attinorum]|uniref:Histone H1 n=1 Tax=Cyphellophora attinorum TaxID=1664694 RepID=A0A0N1HHC0_9EURO|nr:Histone H1 [Phialophora attinorum]KPI45366.1 Histone H1 [Phialophora attinorum]